MKHLKAIGVNRLLDDRAGEVFSVGCAESTDKRRARHPSFCILIIPKDYGVVLDSHDIIFRHCTLPYIHMANGGHFGPPSLFSLKFIGTLFSLGKVIVSKDDFNMSKSHLIAITAAWQVGSECEIDVPSNPLITWCKARRLGSLQGVWVSTIANYVTVDTFHPTPYVRTEWKNASRPRMGGECCMWVDWHWHISVLLTDGCVVT